MLLVGSNYLQSCTEWLVWPRATLSQQLLAFVSGNVHEAVSASTYDSVTVILS